MANTSYPSTFLLQGGSTLTAMELSGFPEDASYQYITDAVLENYGFVPGGFHVANSDIPNLPVTNNAAQGQRTYLANGASLGFRVDTNGHLYIDYLDANNNRLLGASTTEWPAGTAYSDYYAGVFKTDDDRYGVLVVVKRGTWTYNQLVTQTSSYISTNLETWLNGAIASDDIIGTGGGATHIAKVTGVLSTLENNLSDILIVAGGGGGGMVSNETEYNGANAGGISGSGSNSADQSTGYAFGQGEASGGGGGLYGGYKAANGDSGGAGSGYIGNALLDAKKMVGYNVPTSSAESTKTESVNIYSQTAEENTPKAGNGFAKITWIRDLTL